MDMNRKFHKLAKAARQQPPPRIDVRTRIAWKIHALRQRPATIPGGRTVPLWKLTAVSGTAAGIMVVLALFSLFDTPTDDVFSLLEWMFI